MQQGSEEWFKQRLGKVTASRVSDVMAKTKSGAAASRKNYMMELLCQRLTGIHEETFVSTAMQRGTDLEPIARAQYEIMTQNTVDEAIFVEHPDIENFGASPDGLIHTDGLLEIKCPNTAQHVAFIRTGNIPIKYEWQILAQMACTQRSWCDFVSYDDRMPDELQISYKRFFRDQKRIDIMEKEIAHFLNELKELELDLRERSQ